MSSAVVGRLVLDVEADKSIIGCVLLPAQRHPVRGIVRGQTFFPSGTGCQTFEDVAGHQPARQGGADLPGRNTVRHTPNHS